MNKIQAIIVLICWILAAIWCTAFGMHFASLDTWTGVALGASIVFVDIVQIIFMCIFFHKYIDDTMVIL